MTHSVTGEIVIVDGEQVARTRNAPNRVRRAGAEEIVDRSCVPCACDLPAHRRSQVQVNVNVQILRAEYKSGLFDFLCNGARMRRLALDRFTVEIAADAPRGDVPAFIEGITALSNILPCHLFASEVSDTAASGQRAPSPYVAVCDDDRSSDSRGTGSPALDIWV